MKSCFVQRILSFILVSLLAQLPGCDEPCEEPSSTGTGVVGDDCETINDCSPGLACIGTELGDFGACSEATDLPGGADPGCLAHADLWTEHESEGHMPPSQDDEGCEILTFIRACTCVKISGSDGCRPIQPFYRREVWRQCDGCCWKLVGFWFDSEICEATGG